MKKDRQLVILLAALLVLIFLSSCAAGKNTSIVAARARWQTARVPCQI